MPQKKLFAALLVAASALLMLGMSNENQSDTISVKL